jgi:ribonuclease HIII
MNTTIKIKEEEVIYFKAFLESRDDVTSVEVTSEYEAFRAKIGKNTIVGFKTGSIVINNEELKSIVSDILEDIRRHKLDYDYIIGSDETGKGEWLGPLVVSAVALTPKQTLLLQGEGVRDSKSVSPKEINRLSSLVKDNCIFFDVYILYPIEFNYLFETSKDKGENLNDILAGGHFSAISNVLDKLDTRKKIVIVIDEFDKVKTNKKMKTLPGNNIQIIQKPKAEEETAVAAASIIARLEREKIIDELSEKCSLDLRNMNIEEISNITNAEEIVKIDYINDF